MKTIHLYSLLKLPPNLQHHLFLVTAVGKYIVDHWQGPKINPNQVIDTLLVHDLGNLVKYDFSDQARLLDSSLDPAYWSNVQRQVVHRYGAKDTETTLAMLKELNFSPTSRKIIRTMNAARLKDAYQESLELQICEYADMRVSPQGVTSLEKRLRDLRKRYQSRGDVWVKEALFNDNLQYGKKIERRLEKHTAKKIAALSDKDLRESLVELREYQLNIPLWTSLLFRIRHFVKPLDR